MTISDPEQLFPVDDDAEEMETSENSLEHENPDCVTGDTIHLSQCGVGKVEANEAKVSDSGVSQIYAESAVLRDSAVGYVQAKSVYMEGGGAGMVLASSATLADSRNGLLISREVHGSQVNAVVFLASNVTGPVETLVDQRGLVLIGIVAGAAIGTIFSLFRLFKRR